MHYSEELQQNTTTGFHVIGSFLILKNTKMAFRVKSQDQMSPKFNHLWASP